MHERSHGPRRGRAAAQPYSRLKPGPGRPASAVEADQRQRVHRAMIDMVAEKGYEAVTVRGLARLAGVSTETFYALFDGKEDCFVATYAMVVERTSAAVASARSRRRGRPGQLRASLRSLLDSLAADPSAAHLALVDIFAGGPAAIAEVRLREATLELALQHSLDRREDHVSPAAVSWTVAGALRVARPLDGGAAPQGDPLDELAAWGLGYLGEDLPDLSGRDGPPGAARGTAPRIDGGGAGSDDRRVILAAVSKLARDEGYWRLSIPAICRRAGVSRARFNRYFAGIEDCYLAAIRELAGRYFAGLAASGGPDADWATGTRRGVAALCLTAAADPGLAKLVFLEVLAPGVDGMRCREELIGELAARWRPAARAKGPPGQLATEATIAALWSAVGRGLDQGDGSRLWREASTYALLLLAPVLGAGAAVAAIEQENRELETVGRV